MKKALIIIGSVLVVLLTVLILFRINNKDVQELTYEVSFETNGGSMVNTQIVKKGEKAKKPTEPVREGYIFLGWFLDDEIYDFNREVTSNLLITVKWKMEEVSVETFKVVFDSDGGSLISEQILQKCDRVIKPANPTKEGYIFLDWFLNDEVYDFNKVVEENFELKAKWEKEKTTTDDKPSVKKYTVTFNSNGGSNVSSKTVSSGNKVTKPTNPTRTGYKFIGWTLNDNIYDFNSAVISNITLVAKWEEVVKNNYTVTFDSNGGSSISSQNVLEGNKISEPTSPTKEGYTFVNWTLDGKDYNFDNFVTKNIILKANWSQKTYKVVANPVDKISTARVLSVYEDGKLITVKSFKYSDGVTICSGSNPNTDYYAITGETQLKIVLTGGTTVTASLVIN